MSASSCVHGARADMSWRLEQRTPVPCVVMRFLLVSMSAVFEGRKEDSSVLLPSMQRNSCQYLEELHLMDRLVS